MEDKAEKAIKYAKELLELYKYGTPLKFGEDENEMLKILLMVIEGKDCVIETQAHNEEVLMEYFNRNTCLHCGKGKPAYCEDCYQELIGINAKLQNRIIELITMEDISKDPTVSLYKEMKPECTDKEWSTCRVEKRGCEGCHYYLAAKRKSELLHNTIMKQYYKKGE